MKQNLYNKKNEKILSIISFDAKVIANLFDTHNFYGIFFFDDAKGHIVLDDQKIQITTNNVLFYYPFQKINFEGNFNGTFIQFHPDYFCIDIHAKDVGCQGVLFNNFFNDLLLTCSQLEYNDLLKSYTAIRNELAQKSIGQLDMVSSHLKMLLIKAVRIKKEQFKDRTAKKERLHCQIEKLIDSHFKKESSSDFYAKKLEVSVTTFNRLCKKFFDNSFVTILSLKRIAAAKNRLFLTNFPIKDIAYEIGYNDPLYFTRVFKKHTGTSPKDFRKQLKNNRLV